MGLVDTYYTRSFSTFSGADIRASFASVEIGTLQAISYAIQREKAPIYVLGKPNPRAFSRGKRGIAGTLIFVMFDDHALLSTMEDNNGGDFIKFVKDNDELSDLQFAGIQDDPEADPVALESDLSNVWDDWKVAKAFYVDQIPPFDITVSAMNEVGAAAVFRIWGCELLNEGYGISVDDMVSEQQMTYVARAISRWRRSGSTTEGGQVVVPDDKFTATYQGGGTVIKGNGDQDGL